MQARRVVHSGDRDDSNISWVGQRFVCIWSLSLKNELPATRLDSDIHWNKWKIIHFNLTVQRKIVTLAKFQFIHLPKCVWHNCELIRKLFCGILVVCFLLSFLCWQRYVQVSLTTCQSGDLQALLTSGWFYYNFCNVLVFHVTVRVVSVCVSSQNTTFKTRNLYKILVW